jgi:2-oxoglutarate ferredoxin oxidoreductase subunit beta
LRTTAIGVYRDVRRATYDDLLHEQLAAAVDDQGVGDRATLERLIAGSDTWSVDS